MSDVVGTDLTMCATQCVAIVLARRRMNVNKTRSRCRVHSVKTLRLEYVTLLSESFMFSVWVDLRLLSGFESSFLCSVNGKFGFLFGIWMNENICWRALHICSFPLSESSCYSGCCDAYEIGCILVVVNYQLVCETNGLIVIYCFLLSSFWIFDTKIRIYCLRLSLVIPHQCPSGGRIHQTRSHRLRHQPIIPFEIE